MFFYEKALIFQVEKDLQPQNCMHVPSIGCVANVAGQRTSPTVAEVPRASEVKMSTPTAPEMSTPTFKKPMASIALMKA